MANIDKSAMLNGWLMGRKARGMMNPERKAQFYSYNGTVLPGLPEWDKEIMPYAFIKEQNSNIQLIYTKFCKDNVLAGSFDGQFYYGIPCVVYDYKNNAWELWIDASQEPDHREYIGVNAPRDAIWTNYDMCYSNGDVFLPASEPIPIYD